MRRNKLLLERCAGDGRGRKQPLTTYTSSENGGDATENLRLKPRETKLKPPGISRLLTHTPQEAAAQMRAVFGPGTRMFEASHVIGTASLDDIRAAGFDVLPDPTANFPNHFRLIHPG